MDIFIQLFIGVAVCLVWYILSKDRGEKAPRKALWAAVGFGFAGLVLSAILELIFIPIDIDGHVSLTGVELSRVSLLIGAIEELSKFLPLALFIYHKKYFSEHNDGVLYFAIAGLAFGVPENILYTLDGGAGTGIVRLIMTPVFHAATTAIVGYFLIRMKIEKRDASAVVGALGAVILAHAAYDYGLLNGKISLVLLSLAITIGLTALLFVFIHLAYKGDKSLGLRRPVGRAVIALTEKSVFGFGVEAPALHFREKHANDGHRSKKSGLAITAIILGVFSVILCWLPVFGLLLGLSAVLFGAFGYKHDRVPAVIGIGLGSVGLAISLVWTGLVVLYLLSSSVGL